MPRWTVSADMILDMIREQNIETLELMLQIPIEEVVRQAEERVILNWIDYD